MPEIKKEISVIGIFKEEEMLLSAIEKIRERGVEINDVFMPYPVHGITEAAGFKKTRLPYAAVVFGIIGLVLTWLFIYWTSVISYPLLYGGKPIHSIPPIIVICFLMVINIGSWLSVITFFIRTKLFPGKKARIIDPRVTDDMFAIVIDKGQNMGHDDVQAITAVMKDNGAIEVNEKEV